jgi:hypothetical protein
MSQTPTGLNAGSLETATRHLIFEEEAINSNFSSPEILDYINEAVRRLSTYLGWQLAIFTATSVEGKQTYSFPGHVICLLDFYFDNRALIIVDRTDMPNIDQNWRNAAEGRPRYAYRADRDKFGLYQKPDAANASKEMRFQAVKLPDTLVNSTDLADIHIAFHDCIPYYAAFKCELKAGNNQRAADFLKIYKDYRDEIKGVLEKTSEQLMAFHFGEPIEEPRTLS